MRALSVGARPISSIFSREHADIPKDTGVKRLDAPLPTSLTHTHGGKGKVEIYVMVIQSAELPLSPDGLGVWK